MELRNIKTFLYVAEQRSFSKAAALLGYAQSTVTAQIQQLEQEFDVLLFERVRKTVRLTKAGEEFLVHANKLLRAAEDARIALKRLPEESGELRIAMADSLCTAFFAGILEKYHMRYPQVEVRLMTGGTDDLFAQLANNQADMVYTLDQRIYSSDLVTALEQETNVLFVAAPGYLTGKAEMSLAELTRQKFILTERGMSYRKQLDQVLAANALEIIPFLEMGNVDVIRTLVERSLGLSFLPEYTVKESLQSGKLARVKVTDGDFHIWRQLIYHKNKWVTPQMQAMIELMN